MEERQLWYDADAMMAMEPFVEVPAALQAVAAPVEHEQLQAASSFFQLHGIDVAHLSGAAAVDLHERLQRVPLGEGTEDHISEVYRTTAALDDCFAYTKAEMGLYSGGAFNIELTDWTPIA